MTRPQLAFQKPLYASVIWVVIFHIHDLFAIISCILDLYFEKNKYIRLLYSYINHK